MSAVSSKKIILFEEDWDYFPSAIPHWETKNESWRKLAILYRREFGIKNCAFFMALLNPRLKDIDPHDPNLTVQQTQWVVAECYLNPWYFFREVVRIPPKAGDNSIPFGADRGNISLLWGFFTCTNWYQTQIRQTGKSMTMLAIFCYLMYIRSRNVEIMQLTKDGDARAKTVRDVRDLRNRLPAYLWTLAVGDSTNKEDVTYKSFNNLLSVKIPRSDRKQATNIGRGLTSPLFNSDETCFTKYIEEIVPAGIGAMGAARKEALQYGDLTNIIYTCTAGELDKTEGRWAYGIWMNSTPFTEGFYDCKDQVTLHQAVMNSSPTKDKRRVCRIGGQWNHAQLGYTDEWLRDTMTMSEGSRLQKDRDFMNIWTNGSAESPLTPEMIAMLVAGQRDIQYMDISEYGYVLNWYIPQSEIAERMKNSRFVVGMDTSDAGGRDAIGFVMVDVETLETIATGRYNLVSLHQFARWIADLLIKYETITLIPERKSSAISLIDTLEVYLREAGIDIYKRIFSYYVHDHAMNPAKYQDLLLPMGVRDETWYAQRKKGLGFMTDAKRRNELYSRILMEGITDTNGQLRDRSLTAEILGLVVKNGRIDHEDGLHDDMTISWMLAMWFIKAGKKQIHYGIDPLRVMSKLKSAATSDDPYERYLQKNQERVRMRVAALSEELKQEDSGVRIDQIEAELRSYKDQLKGTDASSISIDALITKAREERNAASRSYARDRHADALSSSAWRNMGNYSGNTFGNSNYYN